MHRSKALTKLIQNDKHWSFDENIIWVPHQAQGFSLHIRCQNVNNFAVIDSGTNMFNELESNEFYSDQLQWLHPQVVEMENALVSNSFPSTNLGRGEEMLPKRANLNGLAPCMHEQHITEWSRTSVWHAHTISKFFLKYIRNNWNTT